MLSAFLFLLVIFILIFGQSAIIYPIFASNLPCALFVVSSLGKKVLIMLRRFNINCPNHRLIHIRCYIELRLLITPTLLYYISAGWNVYCFHPLLYIQNNWTSAKCVVQNVRLSSQTVLRIGLHFLSRFSNTSLNTVPAISQTCQTTGGCMLVIITNDF